MGQKYSKELQNNLGNDFYQSCSNGHVNDVRELLPILNYDEVNHIDPTTGYTSLHAACLNNHYEIVRLLLENNVCNRLIKNKNNQTAYDLTSSKDIRALFNRPRCNQNDEHRFIRTRENDSPFRLVKNSSPNLTRPDNWVTGYFSNGEARDAQLMLALSHASPLIKLLLYTRTESESQKIVQRLIEMYIPIAHSHYQRSQKLYQEFLKKKTVRPLLTIYTLDTPFVNILQSNADAFTVILYLHLRELSDRAYQGVSFRGMIMSSAELDSYRWAHEHASILETRIFQSTSKYQDVANAFADRPFNDGNHISVIIRYQFRQFCPTAINLKDISHFETEDEILLLPFTLFRVTSIKQSNENMIQRYEITMENIPVVQKSLWTLSRKKKKNK